MNKIYKVVWNKARNCYVVASEFAKNHQTGSSRIKAASVAAVMAATMLTIGTGVIYAADVAVSDRGEKNLYNKETILYDNTTDNTTQLNDPNLKHVNPNYPGNGHTDKCGELTYNTTLTIGDINKVVDRLVENDNVLYAQDIKNVTMENGSISLIRNDGSPVTDKIALTGNDGTNGQDTSVTVKVGDKSQTFQTGSVVTAETDANGKATGLTINGTPYDIKDTTYSAGDNVTIDKDGHTDYKVNLNKDLTGIESMTNGSSSIRMGNGGTVTINKVTIDQSGKISGVAAGRIAADSTDAINGSQLKDVESVANKGWNLSTNGNEKATQVKPGDTVDFSGDDNISVANDGTKVTMTLKKDLTGLNSAKFGDTTINTDGLTVGSGTSVLAFSTKRVSVGGQQIHDVADGEADMDAVNMRQLNKQTAASKTTVSDGTNTTVTSTAAEDGHTDYKVNLNKDLTGIESMTNGSSSIRMGNGGTVTINKVTIDQSGKISGVAAGRIAADSTDAINGSQLKGVESVANKGWNLSTNGNKKATQVKPGDTVDFSGDDNISVANDGTKVTMTLKKDLTGLNSAKFGDTTINTDGLTVGSGTSVLAFSTKRVSVGGQQIHDVADGEADMDAVNMSQLKKQTAASKTTVSDGTNTTVTSTVAEDGHTDYKVNLNKDLTGIESMTNGSSSIRMGNGGTVTINKVTIDQSGKISGVAAGRIAADSTDAINGSQLKGVESVANKGWNLSTNGNKKATQVKPGDTVDFSGDDNISVANDGTKVTMTLKKDLTGLNSAKFGDTTINTDGLTVGSGTSVLAFSTKRVSVGGQQIHDVADGEADMDAVNMSQLKKQTAASKTTVSDGTNTTVTSTVAEDGHTDYKVNLNKDLTGIESMTNGSSSIRMGNGGTVTINKVTIDQSGKISGVAAGRIAADSTDAINGSQLKGVESVANKGWNLSTNGNKKATQVKPGDTVDFSGDDNISVANDGTKVTMTLKKDLTGLNSAKFGDTTINTDGLTVGSGTSVLAFSTKRVSVGGQQIHDVADGEADMDAVNMSQLKKQTAASKTTVSDGTNTTVTSTVAEDGHTDYKVNLNKDLTGIESMTNGSSSIRMGNGGTVTINKVTIDQSGKISGVAAGRIAADSTDAINGSQLKGVESVANKGWNLSTNGNKKATQVKPGDTVDFSGDDNISVANDGTKVTMTLKKDLTGLNSAKFGDTTINTDGLTVGSGTSVLAFSTKRVSVGGQQIHDVADGEADMDAVNMSQLKKQTAASKTTVSDGTNTTVTSTVAEDGHTDYKVNLNKDLTGIESMTNGSSSIRMGNGGTVTINKVTIDQSGKISGVAAGRIAADSTDAINGSQLKDVESVANKGWNLSTNGNEKATQVKPGDTVDFSGDDNISVANDGTKVTMTLKKDLTGLNSAKFGDTTINTDGLTVGSGTSVLAFSTKRVSVGGQQIHDVADGEADMDAVNMSQLKKQTAASKTTVSDGTNTTVTSTVAEDGHTDYKVNLNKDLTGIESMTNGSSSIRMGNGGTVTINKVTIDQSGKISGVAAGRIAADSTDAINGSQLHAVQQEAGKHTKVVKGSNITVEETDQDGQKTYKVGLNKDLLLGDIPGKNVSISGTNGTIETTGSITTKDRVYADKGAKLADVDITGDTISNDKSSVKLDKEGTVTVNNKVTIDGNGKVSGVAAGEISDTSTDAVNGSQLKATNDRVSKVEGDITNIKGDITTIKGDVTKLGDRVTKVEQTAGKHSSVSTTDSNLSIDSTGTNDAGGIDYKVSLKNDLKLDSVTTGNTVMNKDGVTVGKDISLTKDGLTAGDTKVTNAGLSISDKTYVSKDGLNANNQTITNVANGKVEKGSTEAVNGGQLYNETRVAKDGNFVKKSNTAGENLSALDNQVTANTESIYHMNGRISDLDNRVNKVGAGAAALAALHPLDFDPDAKWDFAAGYGNYRGANAAAVGAYYRPNEDTMFSVGGTFGNGENMVNAGVSFKLGSGSSHVSTSRVAMAKEIKELRGELEAMKSAMLDANAGKKIDTSKLQLFPDVPQNHWAYEYVAQLAGNGMIEGYPDGNFAGDRPMTRYEFAAILYRAMTKGAVLSDKILSEFSHELEYFTVDTIAKDKAGNPTIQRVRTVKENKNK